MLCISFTPLDLVVLVETDTKLLMLKELDGDLRLLTRNMISKIQICTSKEVGLNVADEICNLMSSHSK